MIAAKTIADAIRTLQDFHRIVLDMADGRTLYIRRTGTQGCHPELAVSSDTWGYGASLTNFVVATDNRILVLRSEGNPEVRVTICPEDVVGGRVVMAGRTVEELVGSPSHDSVGSATHIPVFTRCSKGGCQ